VRDEESKQEIWHMGWDCRRNQPPPSFTEIDLDILATWEVEICHIPMFSAMVYITTLAYRPTCDTMLSIFKRDDLYFPAAAAFSIYANVASRPFS